LFQDESYEEIFDGDHDDDNYIDNLDQESTQQHDIIPYVDMLDNFIDILFDFFLSEDFKELPVITSITDQIRWAIVFVLFGFMFYIMRIPWE